MKTFNYLKPLFFLALIGLALGFLASPSSAPLSYLVSEARLDEASGIAASHRHPGILYSHNDSGKPAEVFALSTKGELRAIMRFSELKNRDWEDIATLAGNDKHPGYIYIGEIGDNNAQWESVFVYRLEEPEKLSKDMLLGSPERYEIRYADGPRDAEALFVDPRTLDIYLISKREKQVGVYRVKYPQSSLKVNIAEKVCTLPMSWVTAADISSDGSQILIKTYTEVYSYKRGKKTEIAKALKKKPVVKPYLIEPQGEAICFEAKGKGRYTLSERSGESPLNLYYYK